MKDSLFRTIADLEETGESGVLCTIIRSRGSTPRHAGSKMLVFSDGSFTGTIGGGEIENRIISEALQSLQSGQSRLLSYNMVNPQQGDPGICGGTVEVYLEPIIPKPALLIIGGGHVGKAVAHLGKWLGFRILISDDRPEFCTPTNNPDADAFLPISIAELPQNVKITSQTYIILTTRGVNIDIPGLPALLDTPAAYIGIIGSKRRWLTTRQALLDQGIPIQKLNRVISPIGLELNAETPEEIAVSILAEIIMLRNGGSGNQMKLSNDVTG